MKRFEVLTVDLIEVMLVLVLSRRIQETVVVGGGGRRQRVLKVTVLKIDGGKVTLGFDGDRDIPVHRLEVWERMFLSGELDSHESVPLTPPIEND